MTRAPCCRRMGHHARVGVVGPTCTKSGQVSVPFPKRWQGWTGCRTISNRSTTPTLRDGKDARSASEGATSTSWSAAVLTDVEVRMPRGLRLRSPAVAAPERSSLCLSLARHTRAHSLASHFQLCPLSSEVSDEVASSWIVSRDACYRFRYLCPSSGEGDHLSLRLSPPTLMTSYRWRAAIRPRFLVSVTNSIEVSLPLLQTAHARHLASVSIASGSAANAGERVRNPA